MRREGWSSSAIERIGRLHPRILYAIEYSRNRSPAFRSRLTPTPHRNAILTMDRKAAEQAMADIERSRGRSFSLHNYARSGPVFAAWGIAWLTMNLTRYYGVPHADFYGAAVMGAAVLISIVFPRRGQGRGNAAQARKLAIGSAVSGAALVGLLILVAASDRALANATVSWIAASLYAVAGIWFGTRISVIGVLLGLVVLAAWFLAREHFELILGLAGGGVLVLTGLWLWRA